MIAHVVLFRPKVSLDASDRAALADAFTAAMEATPSVRRVRVGARVLTGRPYEQSMSENYTHAALIEFEDRAALQAYLEHPTHQALAARFFESFEAALIYDYEMGEDAAALL